MNGSRLEGPGPTPGRDAPERRVRFVLVQPQSGGNVGSCARVLKNNGFGRLVLVEPAEDPLGEEALRMAVSADDVLRSAERCDDLDAALAGCRIVVGTTRRVGKQRRPHDRFDALAGALCSSALAGAEVAVVYGREDHGLADHDLDRCTHLAYLPADEGYPSFNLAQAVGITAWIVARTIERDRPDASNAPEREPPAEHEEREAMFRHLETALLTIGFLHHDSVEPLMRRLRRLIGRASPTAAEVKMLRGVARQILWAAGRAELPVLDRETVRRGGSD